MKIRKIACIGYIAAFVCGMVIMMLEGLGFRILAPYFGYSVYVSGALIGIVLLSLSLGYLVGGWLADRHPTLDFLILLLFISDLFILAGAFLFPLLLALCKPFGLITGSILASVILFGPAMFLLSMVSPFLIRVLCDKDSQLGLMAGSISGVSTVGSIFGIFFSTFYLIPMFGSTFTFYTCFFFITLLVALSLFSLKRKFLPFGLLVFLSLAFVPLQTDAHVLYEKESLYNHVSVVEQEGILYMKLNQPEYFHSRYDPNSNLTGYYYDYFVLGPLLVENNSNSVLILGVASGTSLLQLHHFYPEKHYVGVDIDEVVLDVGKKFFGTTSIDNLTLVVADGKNYVQQTTERFDVVEIDMYQGGPYIPFYLSTQEFFTEVKQVLTPHGVMMVNILDDGPVISDLSLQMMNTIASVYPQVVYVDIGVNIVIFAFADQRPFDDITHNLLQEESAAGRDDLKAIIKDARERLVQVSYDQDVPVFTDDLAPVELLTYRMLRSAN